MTHDMKGKFRGEDSVTTIGLPRVQFALENWSMYVNGEKRGKSLEVILWYYRVVQSHPGETAQIWETSGFPDPCFVL